MKLTSHVTRRVTYYNVAIVTENQLRSATVRVFSVLGNIYWLKRASIMCRVRLQRQTTCQSSHIHVSVFFPNVYKTYFIFEKKTIREFNFIFCSNVGPNITIIRVAGFRANV